MVLALLALIVWVLIPHLIIICDSQKTRTLSNMRFLHIATRQMALDREMTGHTNIGWPRDIGGSFSNWTAQLLQENYLSRSDLAKVLSVPGFIVSISDPFTNNNTGILVYAVSTNSPDSAVFLSSVNFTNTPAGGILNSKVDPYRDKSFIVFRKEGDGAILKPRQVGMTNLIGPYVPLCH